MPAEFNWYTDEEDLPETASTISSEATARRSWLMIVVVVVAVVLLAGLLFQQLNKRSERIGAAAKADIKATDELVQQAAAESDVDLITTFLSGRDPNWSETQKQLVRQGLLFELNQLGFLDASEEIRAGEITLSPDLNEAEVSTLRPYHIAVGRGITESVTLEHTATYRRGEDRWLLAPPDSDFWGESSTTTGEYLTMVFPERDREAAERLGVILEAKLNEMCNTLVGLSCPDDLHVRVTLDPDPSSLLLLADRQTMLHSGMTVDLPTPSLVGIPADEVGYQALFRGYTAQVISAVVVDLVGWECCAHGLFFLAILDKQLEQLALRPWPLGPSDYEDILAILPDIPRFRALWRVEAADASAVSEWQEVYAGIDFLLSHESEGALARMQRTLSPEQEFTAWLEQFVAADLELARLGNEWLEWIQERSLSAQLGPTIALPDQDILALCRSRLNESEATLYRFDPASQSWASEGSAQGFVFMVPLPDDSGVVLQGQIDGSPMTTIWKGARGRLVYGPDTGHPPRLFYTGLTDESGGRIMMFELPESGSDMLETQENFYWLDTESCERAECGLSVLPGRAFSSPSGVNTLYLSDSASLFSEQGVILLEKSDAESPVQVGEGSWIFWLNDDQYGFLRRRTEIVQASVQDETPEILLSVDELVAGIPEEIRPNLVTVEAVISDPAQGGKLAIRATTSALGQRSEFYYLYDFSTDELTLLLALDNVNGGVPRFSSDGRWISFQTGDRVAAESSEPWSLYLLDVEQRRLKAILPEYYRRMAGPDWSADARWLVRSYEGFLELIAPEYDVGDGRPFHQLIVHNISGCDFATWVNR